MAQGIVKNEELLKALCGENISPQPIGNGFEIYVSKNHTFGTDAVLLSHFAAPKKSDKAVDLGTGCGIIPFLWARDGLTSYTAGLEISPEGVALAKASLEKNAPKNTLEFFEGDIKNPFAGGYHPFHRGLRYAGHQEYGHSLRLLGRFQVPRRPGGKPQGKRALYARPDPGYGKVRCADPF